jgi:hypothetical protein
LPAVIHAQSCKGACTKLRFMDKAAIFKKMIVLISSNRCGMVGFGLRELGKAGNKLRGGEEYF